MSRAVRIVGVGNRYRGDDGVGLSVIEALGDSIPGASLGTSDGEITGLLAEFQAHQEVLIVDALDAGDAHLEPGSIVRLDPIRDSLKDRGLRASTHAMGIVEAVELARNLGGLPDKLTIVGIVGARFGPTEGLSRRVEAAAREVVTQLWEEYGHA